MAKYVGHLFIKSVSSKEWVAEESERMRTHRGTLLNLRNTLGFVYQRLIKNTIVYAMW